MERDCVNPVSLFPSDPGDTGFKRSEALPVCHRMGLFAGVASEKLRGKSGENTYDFIFMQVVKGVVQDYVSYVMKKRPPPPSWCPFP